jgi:hypothetical protein
MSTPTTDPTLPVIVPLPSELARAIDALARERDQERVEFIIDFLQQHLGGPPPSFEEIMAPLSGGLGMRIPYMVGMARRPQPALGGSMMRPRPMMPVRFCCQGASVTRTGIPDTGADDTVLPDWIAAAVGLNLSGVEECPIGLAGR